MISPFFKPLIYFDIFNHPLKIDELEQLCGQDQIDQAEIKYGIEQNLCYQYDNFLSLSKEVEHLVKVRLEKEKRAQHYIKKLSFYGKLISKFPFVKGIAVSGSLSKNVMHDDGDIDYFIITHENRLWVCRTFLILFKKIFLLNSRKYFCVNYFIDDKNLEIKDKNIFTAVELTYLLPVYNQAIFDQFLKCNRWVTEEFSAIKHPIDFKVIEERKKGIIERLLSGFLGEKLDLFFMNLTIKKWKSKFKNFDQQKMELTMRSNRGISKHHPSDFQTNVLKAYQEKCEQLKSKHEGFIYS